jgi:hypothetical protein
MNHEGIKKCPRQGALQMTIQDPPSPLLISTDVRHVLIQVATINFQPFDQIATFLCSRLSLKWLWGQIRPHRS